MQTHFSPAQLADPGLREAEAILRRCVHCGMCQATCPTYLLLGDERDSPRGRIYLIKDMLENGRPATPELARHIDRCLSCLACMTTCPSGVNYMHLVDHARIHIERTMKRPLAERAFRAALAVVLPRTALFRFAVLGGMLVRPWKIRMPGRLRILLDRLPPRPALLPALRPRRFEAAGTRRLRVALLTGCVQPVLAPAINAATIRLLTRHGCEVVVPEGLGCCGALTHHLGKETNAHRSARAAIDAILRETGRGGLDAVVVNASGCGTMLKDYGFLLRDEPAYAEKAARVAALTRDVTEIIDSVGLVVKGGGAGQRVAYHSACSMQHGQRLHALPKRLLDEAGFQVLDIPEGHVCCGSAGTYNLLQPELADRLQARKVANIETLQPALVATGNIGCLLQIGGGSAIPVVHTVQLLDWATGGPEPCQASGAGAISSGRAVPLS